MKLPQLLLLLSFLLLASILAGKNDSDLEYEFTRDDTFYTFRGSFLVKGNHDSILTEIFDFDSIHEYSQDLRDITLLDQGDNWYEVSFRYNYLLLIENISVWRRHFYPEQNLITFEILSNSNNIGIIPEIKASSGYYKIHTVKNSYRFELYQDCTLAPGKLNKLYLHKAEKELIKILKLLKKFIEKG